MLCLGLSRFYDAAKRYRYTTLVGRCKPACHSKPFFFFLVDPTRLRRSVAADFFPRDVRPRRQQFKEAIDSRRKDATFSAIPPACGSHHNRLL